MAQILIADDNSEMLDTLTRIFGLYEFDVIKAVNGIEAIEKAEKNKPDIIILDGMMPEMNGFEACQKLKQKESTKDIPVVFLTANFMELRDRIKGFELGADDYLLKPFNSKELVARIKGILKRTESARLLKEENNRLVWKNNLIEKELKEFTEHQSSEHFQAVDPLTGLSNFEFFKDRVRMELLRSQRFNNDLALIWIKLNESKKIKEILGGQIFDFVILKIANFILNQTRVIDLLGFDKDKGFFILLPQTDYSGAKSKVENINSALLNNTYISKDMLRTLEISQKKISDISKFTFSYGVTSAVNKNGLVTSVEELFKKVENPIAETE